MMDYRQLRRSMSPAGWSMLLYYLLIVGCVFVTVLVQIIIALQIGLASDGLAVLESFDEIITTAAASAWGYFPAAVIGIGILLLWKKPKFWKEEIWAKGKPMKPGAFLGILCIFFSTQFIYQFVVIGLEMILNSLGLTVMEGLESLSGGGDELSMFLYMCLLAPVTEELLCRGLVQRILMPRGKKLAIVGSAILFALMHGNVIQTPYAFAAGLVLGYVAAEYSIGWAMVLHLINNLLLGDVLVRLTANMSEMGAALVIWGILLLAVIGAVITLVRKRRELRVWMAENAIAPGSLLCFVSSAGVVTFTVLMVLNMIATCFVLITPL